MQNINAATKSTARKKWRPSGEAAAIDMLKFMRAQHRAQKRRGGRGHHEQSAASRCPFDSDEWPWALSKYYRENSVRVAGCAVGLMDHRGELLLPKEWRVESSCPTVLAAMRPYLAAHARAHIGLRVPERLLGAAG